MNFLFARCVSSIQAAMATVVGFLIAIKCQKDILMDRYVIFKTDPQMHSIILIFFRNV